MPVDRFKLIAGPYQTPKFEFGDIVFDERRGEVEIVAITDGLIPWPIGKRNDRRAIILFDVLADAVRIESNQAVAHWWGVSGQSVTKWRKTLGIPANTSGTLKLRSDYTREPNVAIGLKRAQEKQLDGRRDKARRQKIAAAKRGKKRPKHVIEALRQSHLGKPLSKATRQKMSKSHKRRGTRPPAAGEPWTAEEDAILCTCTPTEAATQTGRTRAAVGSRRSRLGLPDGRRRTR
jgi:Ni/Co efflux regulator RcnB